MLQRLRRKLVCKRIAVLAAYNHVYKGKLYRIEMGRYILGFKWIPSFLFRVPQQRILYRVTGEGLHANTFFDPTIYTTGQCNTTQLVEIAKQMDRYLCAIGSEI